MIRKFFSLLTFNTINFNKPDFDIVLLHVSGKLFSDIYESAVKYNIKFGFIKAEVFEELTTKSVNEGFKLLKSRRTTGKIIYKFKGA